MNLFHLENINFRYGDHTVLDIPRLDIEKGGIVCLTGANGSGKSTLLAILAGLLFPTSGRLLYRGTDLVKAPADIRDEMRREMGICLQSPYLFRTTVEGNVAFGLTARGIKGPEKAERTGQALRDVGLPGFEKRRHQALSGGEIQRVALARALAVAPRVLLLDEPMANVDAATRTLLERILRDLIGARGITIVLSTHDVDQALRLGRQIITLHEGHVVESGLENIFHGTVLEKEEEWVFDTGLCRFVVLPQKQDARTAIIPPEAILLSLDPKGTSARNVLEGTVTGIRMRHGSVEVSIDAGEEFISRITEKSMESLEICLGTRICMLIKAGSIRLY
jgi:molybdopterin-binding protein